MPFPNFHACRLRAPEDFEADSFRVVKRPGGVQIVVGRLRGETTMTAQAVRYPIDGYTEGEARRQCRERGGIRFEPATGDAARRAATPEFASGLEVLSVSQSHADRFFAGAEIESDLVGPMRSKLQLPTENIEGVEMLAVGKFVEMLGRKVTITRDDLDQMVANFHALAKWVKPMLRLRHVNDKTHDRIARLDDAKARPALGWLTNLRVVGNKLVTDIANIPAKLAAMMRAGTFRFRSAEFFDRSVPMKHPVTGKPVPNVITGLAILGEELPAVDTLADVAKLFGVDATEEEMAHEVQSYEWALPAEAVCLSLACADVRRLSEGGDTVEISEAKLQEMIDKATDKGAERAKKEAETAHAKTLATIRKGLGLEDDADLEKGVTDLRAKSEDSEKKLKEQQEAAAKRDVDEFLAPFKKDGKLTPAQEPVVRNMLSSGLEAEIETTDKDGKTVKAKAKEVVKTFLEALTPQLTGEAGEEGEPGKGSLYARQDVPADVARFAKENTDSDTGMGYVIDKKDVEFSQKVFAAMRKNPKLDFEGGIIQLSGGDRAGVDGSMLARVQED